MFSRQKKTRIKAIDETDFASYLRELGVYELITQGSARCAICGKVLTVGDVDAVFPDEGQVKFMCTNPKCSLNFGNS